MPKKITWYYVLLFFAITGVLVTAVLRILTPPIAEVPATEFLQRSVGNTAITYRNLKYEGAEFAPPASLPVAQLQPSSDTTDSLLQSIIDEYNLIPHPRAKNLWQRDNLSLSYNPQSQQASLTFGVLPFPEETTFSSPFPQDQAAAKAESLLQDKFSFLSGVTLYAEYISLLEGGYDLHAAEDPLHANTISLPYGWSIESIPVFIGTSQVFPAEVMVNRELQVNRVLFNPTRLSYTLTPNQPTISVQEAIDQLNNTQTGILLSFHTKTGEIKSFTEISGGTLHTVNLEYRLDPNTNLIYPFYRFTGDITTPTGTSIVDIATPAIKTTPLQ